MKKCHYYCKKPGDLLYIDQSVSVWYKSTLPLYVHHIQPCFLERSQVIMSEWGYGGENGPSCWHMVDDGVYSISLSGVRQSPINIETEKNVIETDEELNELVYEYVPENCTVVGNTGSSWKVDVNPEGSSKKFTIPDLNIVFYSSDEELLET